MSSNAAAPNGDNGNHQGHCSRCGKVWILNERQGICQWCGKPASCQTTMAKPRHIKSRSNGSRKQPNDNGNGYDQLDGNWLTYYKVASHFSHKAKVDDTQDLLHDIIITLADVERNNGHKPFTEATMYRIASRTRADYWREHYRHTRGLDCGHCSNRQRKQCKKDWLYRECPKAIKVESLNKPMIDHDGNMTELGNLIADDTAMDIPQWLERNEQLLHSPDRVLVIAGKIQDGETLTDTERRYINRFRHREQKPLF